MAAVGAGVWAAALPNCTAIPSAQQTGAQRVWMFSMMGVFSSCWGARGAQLPLSVTEKVPLSEFGELAVGVLVTVPLHTAPFTVPLKA